MNRTSFFTATFTAIGAIALGACSTPIISERTGPRQSFPLMAGDGTARGTITVHERAGQATLTLKAAGLPAGTHGVHLHETGVCMGPAFTTAGGHWNPGGKMHGRDNPAGAHLGDLPNLEVAPSGQAIATYSVSSTALADANGTALVVHARADDYRTDPSGNSGDRIACAVIAPPK